MEGAHRFDTMTRLQVTGDTMVSEDQEPQIIGGIAGVRYSVLTDEEKKAQNRSFKWGFHVEYTTGALAHSLTVRDCHRQLPPRYRETCYPLKANLVRFSMRLNSNVSKNLRLSTRKDTKKLEKLRKYKRLSLISCLSWLKRPYDS